MLILTPMFRGEAFFPHYLSNVDGIAHQVAQDVRSQYMIAYKPSNEALHGTFRKIKVTVKAAGSPAAQTRTGYYATANKWSSPGRSHHGQVIPLGAFSGVLRRHAGISAILSARRVSWTADSQSPTWFGCTLLHKT